MRKLWLVGKMLPGSKNVWEFQGIFSREDLAVDHCRNRFYFVAPVKVDEEVPSQTRIWPDAYYPQN